MWDVLAIFLLLVFGAVAFIFVCAMAGWMVYTMQNGVDDD
jgi:hypothetical protein